MKIGRKIKELRKLRGLTQLELAEKIQATEARISNWERGENNPDKEILGRLAEALGVKISDLYSDEDDAKHTSVPKVGPPEDISPERYLKDLQKLNAYQAKELEDQDRKLKEKDKQIVQLQKELENLRRRT